MDIKKTYALGGGIVRDVLNKRICCMVDRAHTICTYNKEIIKRSAGWTLVRRQDDTLSGGGTVAQEGQQDGL